MKRAQQAKKDTTGGRYRIECNYAPEVLIPHEAIERAFYENAKPWTNDVFLTMDGKVCRPEFVMTWSEADPKKMDEFCIGKWNMKFSTIKTLWFDRLNLRYGLRTWHYIRLYDLG